MLPVTHLLVGFALGVMGLQLNLFGPWYAVLTALVSTLIDLDHLVGYLASGGGSLREHWNKLVLDRLRHKRTLIHHARGILLVCLFIALTYFASEPLFFCLGLAYVSHMLLDHLNLRRTPHIREYHLKGLGLILPYSILEVGINLVSIFYLIMWVLA